MSKIIPFDARPKASVPPVGRASAEQTQAPERTAEQRAQDRLRARALAAGDMNLVAYIDRRWGGAR
jgi:hypothetical protein